MKYLPLLLIGVALGFIYLTFEPLINDYIYMPLYGAILAGLGIGGLLALVCGVLCAAGLYIFLAVTKPRMKMGEER